MIQNLGSYLIFTDDGERKYNSRKGVLGAAYCRPRYGCPYLDIVNFCWVITSACMSM